jgi:hypothetical protein
MSRHVTENQQRTQTSSPTTTGILQRKHAFGQNSVNGGEHPKYHQKRQNLQRRANNHRIENSAVPPIVHDVLRSPGQPLNSTTRTFMESRFGHDFSRVRVHTDAKAAASARSVNALAYTVGRDIVFGAGQYAARTDAGKMVLAHELTHFIQQSDIPTKSFSDLEMSKPNAPSELEARRYARNTLKGHIVGGLKSNRLSRLERLLLQRLSVPLVGWGDVPEFADSSSWDIFPLAVLTVGGSTTTLFFSSGQREIITIPLNSDARLKILAAHRVERDDPFFNNTNSWTFSYTWRIVVDDRGRMTIAAPSPSWEGGAGDVPWSVISTPVQGTAPATRTGHVGVGFTLASTETQSSGHSVSAGLGLGVKVEPFGLGGEASGSAGYSYSWGTTTGPTKTAGRGFVVDINVPEPPPIVEIGPITMIWSRAFYFRTGRDRLGVHPATREDQNMALTAFLRSLDPENNGGVGLSGFVDGYASPVGRTEANRDLARRRADYVMSRIRDTLPRANFRTRVFGEDLWYQEGVPDIDDSERHRVVIMTIESTSAD